MNLSRRAILIAVQLALVLVLIGVVYAWLLAPQDEGPLRGITTPDHSGLAAGNPHGGPGGPRVEGRHAAGGRHGKRHRPDARARVRVARAPAGGPPLGTPVAKQYADTATALLARVAKGSNSAP